MHFRGKSKHESGISCKTHKTYSLSCDDFEALWERSGGTCEACGYEPPSAHRGLVIDHDHQYGDAAVRGLLCRWCNVALGQLENPDINPAFGTGPGSWFAGYLRRAWFVRNQREVTFANTLVDRNQLHEELRRWRKYNKALFSPDPRAALVPLDQPSVIVQILREEMSHQAFGALVRAANKAIETPKPRSIPQ